MAMRIFKLLLLTVLVIGLCSSYAVCAMKGSGYEQKGSPVMEKGSGGEAPKSEDVQVSGKIMFTDYYSMAGQKCAAFLESEDGGLFCVLENENSDKLKERLSGKSGKVKITGAVTDMKKGKYIEVEKYDVVKEAPSKKIHEYKGSY